MNLEKLKRLFEAKLTEAEIAERVKIAIEISQYLVNQDQWKNWITGIYIFGSTVKGSAKSGSDIDLGIRTKQHFYFGMDFAYIHSQLKLTIEEGKTHLGIDRTLKINPQIVAETWLANPDSQPNPEFLKELLAVGILIYEKP